MARKRTAIENGDSKTVTLYRFDYHPIGEIRPGPRMIHSSPFPFVRRGSANAHRDPNADLAVMKSFLKSVLLRFATRNDKLVYGATPSKEARKTIRRCFWNSKFELCCRRNPVELVHPETKKALNLRLRDLVLVIRNGEGFADNVVEFTVAKRCVLDRIVLPQDTKNGKPFIPWAANAGKPLYIPLNSVENDFVSMDRVARELVSSIHILEHPEHDSAKHARSKDSLADIDSSQIEGWNRMQTQNQRAGQKKRPHRLLTHLEKPRTDRREKYAQRQRHRGPRPTVR